MKQNFVLLTFLLIFTFSIDTTFAKTSDKTEIRDVKNFNAIKVSSGIDLVLTMGETEAVKIVANGDIIEKIITEVKNGTLHIYIKNNNWFNCSVKGARKAYVTINELQAISASSGADVHSENTLQGENLNVSASSGSDVYIDVFYKNFDIDVSSGSDAKLSGKVKRLKAEASSGSDIKAKELKTQICKAHASSGSDIAVSVADELYAHASSGGDIRYYGNPEISDIEESSGGDVIHK
jgi:hypothetical protein